MRIWVGAAVACALAACGPAPENGGTRGARSTDGRGAARSQLRVAAAADLNAALPDLIARFSAEHPVDVAVSYGSSGTFFSQLVNGAPFDLFLSADADYPRRLTERGLTLDDGEFRYAIGRLVVWTTGPPASESQAPGVNEVGLPLLADPAIKRVAIANPQHAPYGRAAVAALHTAGIYDKVQAKLVYGENVAQALQFAQSGGADAGVVPLSLVVSPAMKNGGRWQEIPGSAHPPIEQAGVILKTTRDAAAARAFRGYLTGPEGRAILERYGFALPER